MSEVIVFDEIRFTVYQTKENRKTAIIFIKTAEFIVQDEMHYFYIVFIEEDGGPAYHAGEHETISTCIDEITIDFFITGYRQFMALMDRTTI